MLRKILMLIGAMLIIISIFISCSHSDKSTPTIKKPIEIEISTTEISNMTCSTSISGGNVYSDGGSLITSRGVCWDTGYSPTVALSTKTIDSGSKGSFISNITGLSANTTYFVRAYATNSVGTYYGESVKFKTYSIEYIIGGGIIFYIDSTGKHGLICATTDQSTSAQWDAVCYQGDNNYKPETTGAAGTAIGTGAANTDHIIATLGRNGVAASLCRDYRGGGYTDWFLPSKDELKQLYKSRNIVNRLADNKRYWSSTEYLVTYKYSPQSNHSLAWSYRFDINDLRPWVKSESCNVRAVRAF